MAVEINDSTCVIFLDSVFTRLTYHQKMFITLFTISLQTSKRPERIWKQFGRLSTQYLLGERGNSDY